MALSYNLIAPSEGAFNEGFDKRIADNASRRAANRDALLKMGDEFAAQGVGFGVDEWAQQAKSMLGFGDFLNSTSLAPDMLEAMRRSQSAKAEKAREMARRDQFKADQEEANAIQKDVQDQALSGRSTPEIAAYLQETYKDRATKVIPRLDAMVNSALLGHEKQGAEFGKAFMTQREAQSYIDANPGLNEPQKRGLLRAARVNEIDLEKTVYSIGDKIGSNYGVVDNPEVRQAVETMIPSYITDPAQRAELTERALKVARASGQTKLASDQAGVITAGQKKMAESWPDLAKTEAVLFASDRKEREARAEKMGTKMMSPITFQDEFLKNATAQKKYKPAVTAELSRIMSQHVVTDIDRLAAAIEDGRREDIDLIVAASPTKTGYAERSRAVAGFVNQPPASLEDAAQQLQNIAVQPQQVANFGAGYRRLMDASGGIAEAKPAKAQARTISVPQYGPNGMVVGYEDQEWNTTGSASSALAGSERKAAASAMASTLRQRFVTESAQLLAAARDALSASQRYDATPEQVSDLANRIAVAQARQFAAGAGYKGPEAEKLAASLAYEIRLGAGQLSGTTREESEVERYRRTIREGSGAIGMPGAGSAIPGSVQPSPRLNRPF